MNIEVNWTIPLVAIGLYDTANRTCVITHINTNDAIKEIWSVTYHREWTLECGCCKENRNDIAYSGQFTEEVRKLILERLPDHTIQKIKWS